MNKPHICEICRWNFTRPSRLTRHMQTHTGERPYKCEECGKSFKQNENLKLHMMIHTGENLFKCEECGKNFALTSYLKLHMQTHTGEKPFKCEECPKSFIRKHHLKNHMRTHNREKPYKCEQCEQYFAREADLIRHLQWHRSLSQQHFEQQGNGQRQNKCDRIENYSENIAETSIEDTVQVKDVSDSSETAEDSASCLVRDTEDRKFVCCGKVFYSWNSMRRHQKADHKKETNLFACFKTS